MKTVDGQVVMTDIEQRDADLADDELRRIISLKEEMVDWLDKIRALRIKDSSALEACVEQEFNEHFYHRWHQLCAISGSLDWPFEIPSREELMEKLDKERRLNRKARNAEARIREANMATAVELGKVDIANAD